MQVEYSMQLHLFKEESLQNIYPVKNQLLKWVGNKQRFAAEIVSNFPNKFNNYIEPFLGSGAVLATLAPERGLGSDCFQPLMEIWNALSNNPSELKKWYETRWLLFSTGSRKEVYERIKASYNRNPNGADLLFLCRSCYGGVVRFRKNDGYMSTPCGPHNPIPPKAFSNRVDEWHERTRGTEFRKADYVEAMNLAQEGDLVYCDPPYNHSQAILYGAQSFSLEKLVEIIADCKARGVFIALSIDGTKKSGSVNCQLPIPEGLFEREIFIDCGRSMLKRLQMGGKTLKYMVTDQIDMAFRRRYHQQLVNALLSEEGAKQLTKLRRLPPYSVGLLKGLGAFFGRALGETGEDKLSVMLSVEHLPENYMVK